MKLTDLINETRASSHGMIVLFHGTTDKLADIIQRVGLRPPGHLSPDRIEAQTYAFMGGEDSYERRKREYRKEHGHDVEIDYPNYLEMQYALYPSGEYPVMLTFNLPKRFVDKSRNDPGSDTARVFDIVVPAHFIVNYEALDWY